MRLTKSNAAWKSGKRKERASRFWSTIFHSGSCAAFCCRSAEEKTVREAPIRNAPSGTTSASGGASTVIPQPYAEVLTKLVIVREVISSYDAVRLSKGE